MLTEAAIQAHYAYHPKDKDLFTRLNLAGRLNRAKQIWESNPAKYANKCHYECEVIAIYKELK